MGQTLGVGVGEEHLTDLDYAVDVALLAEMLQTLVQTAGTTG